jgi:hypothetical protein
MTGSDAGMLVISGMLLSSLVGVVCVLLHRPRRLAAVVGAATMAAAMVDMVLGYIAVPPVIWFVALVMAGLAVGRSALKRATPHSWSQALCLLVTAGMVLVADHGAAPPAAGPAPAIAGATSAMGAGPHGMSTTMPGMTTASGTLQAVTWSLLLAYVGFLTWRAVSRTYSARRTGASALPRPRSGRIHDAAMAACLALMAAMPVVST